MPHTFNLPSHLLRVSAVARGALAGSALCMCWAALAQAAPTSPPYRILTHWSIPGTGGWDMLAVDQVRQRLFVTHSDHVDVVLLRDGSVLGAIAPTSGVHGVALAPDLRRGYTSNGKSNSVTEFDLNSLKVLREVPVSGEGPDEILYVPASHHLYTFNGRSHNTTVFNASDLTVVATVALPGKPEFAVSDGSGRVFVNIESEAGQIAVIDDQQLTLKSTWPIKDCASPSGLALDPTHSRLFSTCENHVMAISDARSGRALAHVPIGDGSDGAVFDAERRLAFSSNGDGTLTVVNAGSKGRYTIAQTLATQPGARTVALDSQSHRLYVVTAQFGPAPAPTTERPHPRPPILPDSMTVLVIGSDSASH